MTTRERWIVYPLLILSLGVSLRDKFIPPARGGNAGLQFMAGEIAAGRIYCSELNILGPNGRPAIIAKADPNSHAGAIETIGSNGVPLVQLLSNEAGGFVTAIGRGGRLGVMGHTQQDFGLFVQPSEKGLVIPFCVWPRRDQIDQQGTGNPPKKASTPPPVKPQEKKSPENANPTPP